MKIEIHLSRTTFPACADGTAVGLPGVLDGPAAANSTDLQILARTSTGAGAIAAILEHRPEVLLLDLELEDMSGSQVLNAWRATSEPLAPAGFVRIARARMINPQQVAFAGKLADSWPDRPASARPRRIGVPLFAVMSDRVCLVRPC